MRFSATLAMLLLVMACSPEKKIAKSYNLGKYQTVINYYEKALSG